MFDNYLRILLQAGSVSKTPSSGFGAAVAGSLESGSSSTQLLSVRLPIPPPDPSTSTPGLEAFLAVQGRQPRLLLCVLSLLRAIPIGPVNRGCASAVAESQQPPQTFYLPVLPSLHTHTTLLSPLKSFLQATAQPDISMCCPGKGSSEKGGDASSGDQKKDEWGDFVS